MLWWWLHSRKTQYFTDNEEVRQFPGVEVGIWFIHILVFSFMSFLVWQLPKLSAEMSWKAMSSHWRVSHHPPVSLGKLYSEDTEVHGTSFFCLYLCIVFLHFSSLPFFTSPFLPLLHLGFIVKLLLFFFPLISDVGFFCSHSLCTVPAHCGVRCRWHRVAIDAIDLCDVLTPWTFFSPFLLIDNDFANVITSLYLLSCFLPSVNIVAFWTELNFGMSYECVRYSVLILFPTVFVLIHFVCFLQVEITQARE